jgi:hypothetical protein
MLYQRLASTGLRSKVNYRVRERPEEYFTNQANLKCHGYLLNRLGLSLKPIFFSKIKGLIVKLYGSALVLGECGNT